MQLQSDLRCAGGKPTGSVHLTDSSLWIPTVALNEAEEVAVVTHHVRFALNTHDAATKAVQQREREERRRVQCTKRKGACMNTHLAEMVQADESAIAKLLHESQIAGIMQQNQTSFQAGMCSGRICVWKSIFRDVLLAILVGYHNHVK